jgi:hypothetical protein
MPQNGGAFIFRHCARLIPLDAHSLIDNQINPSVVCEKTSEGIEKRHEGTIGLVAPHANQVAHFVWQSSPCLHGGSQISRQGH